MDSLPGDRYHLPVAPRRRNATRATLTAVLVPLCAGCLRLVPFDAEVAMRPPQQGEDLFGGFAFSGPDRGLRSTGVGQDYCEIIPRLREIEFGPRRERPAPPPFERSAVGHMTVELDPGTAMVFRPYELVDAPGDHPVLIAPGAFACEETPSVRQLSVALMDAGFDVLVYLAPLHGRRLEVAGTTEANSLGPRESDELVAVGKLLSESYGRPPDLVGLSLGGVGCALLDRRGRAVFDRVVVVAALTGGIGPVFDRLRDDMSDDVRMPPWSALSDRPARVAVAHMYGVALALTMRAAGIQEDAMPTAECLDRYVNEWASPLVDGGSPEDVVTQARMLASLEHPGTTAVFFEQDFVSPPEFAEAAERAGVRVVRLPGGHLAPSSWNAYVATLIAALEG